MHPPIETNNIVEFTCPLSKQWKFGLLFHGKAAESELEKFYAHSEKCKICAIKAVEFLKLEIPGCKKSIQPRKNTLALAIAALLIICIIPCFYAYFYFNLKLSPSKTLILNQNTTNNLYEELETAIDDYLLSSDTKTLQQAQDIANKIYSKNDDRWGIGLVDYYRKTSKTDHPKLVQLRREFSRLKMANFRDNYTKNLKETSNLVEHFLLMGDQQEAYKTKTLLSRIYALNFGAPETVLEDGLSYANQNKFKILEVYFLLWDAKNLIQKLPTSQQIRKLEQVIELGKNLNLNDVIISAGVSLAGYYERDEQNRKALILCEQLKQLINVAPTNKYKSLVSVLQIQGMASFKLGNKKITDSCFYEAIKICKEKNEFFHLALTYAFIANNYTQDGVYEQSEIYLNLAENEIVKLSDQKSYLDIFSTVLAYRAKLKLKTGEYEKSAGLYKTAIRHLETLGLEGRSLEMQQLNEGLFLALNAQGDPKAEDSQVLAVYYKSKAKTEMQNDFSCLLSFVPKQCN